MTFAEWTRALNKAIEILEKEREENCLKMVNDTMALLKRRIINDRVDDEGQAFGQYSEAVVPVWFFGYQDTKRDSATVVEELIDRKGYWASYQDWREVNNLTGTDLNFSFTGEMWKSLVPVVVKDQEGELTIGIVADDASSDKKIGVSIWRFPKLLDLNAKEEKILTTLNQNRLETALKTAGLI